MQIGRDDVLDTGGSLGTKVVCSSHGWLCSLLLWVWGHVEIRPKRAFNAFDLENSKLFKPESREFMFLEAVCRTKGWKLMQNHASGTTQGHASWGHNSDECTILIRSSPLKTEPTAAVTVKEKGPGRASGGLHGDILTRFACLSHARSLNTWWYLLGGKFIIRNATLGGL